ncbi:MAG: HAD family hydrolase [Bacteroidales bacterium]|nr:HAD family hydrolase [Bacteroidales bacterium]MCF8336489.1 HAD family hydrolase [Bacteroidales bacterium]
MNLRDLDIDKEWSLFLDRDGVINRRIKDGYVTKWEEFAFLPGVLEAMKIFSQKFGRIFIITNQQGIGKGLMNEHTLEDIHNKMIKEIEKKGGRIDAIYHCPDLEENRSPGRKPNPGMAFRAQHDFPEVNFSKSLMIGDTARDIAFGRRAGMYTALCLSQTFEEQKGKDKPHFVAEDLLSFALLIK